VVNSTKTRTDEEQLCLFGQVESAAIADSSDWRVRVSGRARNIKIQIYPHGGVEIVAPRRARPAEIAAFVADHHDWIVKTSSRFRQLRLPEPPLPESIELTALGETVRVHYRQGESRQCRERHGLLTISSPASSPADCWPLLQKWLKQRGRAYLIDATLQTGTEIGLNPKRVHIRLQRTRWGSCSTSGTVSLNAALLMRPPQEMHYVIIHELSHLQHMNHSKRFWRLVESHVPDYRNHERSLDAAWQTSPRWLLG
jgi:predicted metal-dependent hydrolase